MKGMKGKKITWIIKGQVEEQVAGRYWSATNTIEVFENEKLPRRGIIRHELVHYFFHIYKVDAQVLVDLITDLYYGPKDGDYKRLYKALGLSKKEIAIVERTEYYLDQLVADSFEQMSDDYDNMYSAMAIAETQFAAEVVVQMERNQGMSSKKAREKVLEVHSLFAEGLTLIHGEEYYLFKAARSARKVFEYAALRGAEEAVANMAAGGLNCFGLKVIYRGVKKYLPPEVRLMIEIATAELGEEIEPDWTEYC